MNKNKSDFVSQFVSQLTNNVPSELLGVKEELKQWAHAFICDWLAQHELVTQQELMVQQKILQRLQNKVEKLELELAESKRSKNREDFALETN